MLCPLCMLVDDRPERKPRGGAAWKPIKDVLGYPLNRSPVRRARSRTGTPLARGTSGWVNSPLPAKAVRYRGLIAIARRAPPSTPPRVRGHPAEPRVPPANRPWTSTAPGNSGYMDTPEGRYVILHPAHGVQLDCSS